MHPSPIHYNPQMQFSEDWVLYADEFIIVANKPSGLLSVPGRGEDKQECLISHLKTRYPDVRIVHRLDMDTSGLLVLARDAESHRRLSSQFETRKTAKTYVAQCAGTPPLERGHVNLPMIIDWERRPLQHVNFLHGKHAQTLWKRLEQHVDYFKVELTPVTGRTHQLRLHMKMLGHPILGDTLYADEKSRNSRSRLMLHAQRLAFTHPLTHEPMAFFCPDDFERYMPPKA